MSEERQHQIDIYLQLPPKWRKELEAEFLQLKRKFQTALPGGEGHVEALVQNIGNIMVPEHQLSDDQFLGLAHHVMEQEL